MKKVIYGLSALAVLGLASCQSEEVVENPSDKEMISFAVTSGNPSRAAQSFCNTSKPEQITVKALVNGTTTEYFNETLTTTDGGKNYSFSFFLNSLYAIQLAVYK